MRPTESTFPCYWWGFGLEVAGLKDVRPDLGTYARYSFDRLPPLPFDLRGDFAWLSSRRTYATHIGLECAAKNARTLQSLRTAVVQLGLALPRSFDDFMSNTRLQEHVRSNTDCYLDLCSRPVRTPGHDGYLVRFLSDSQGCLFWYLYLPPAGADYAVLSSPTFYGTDEELWQDEAPEEPELVFCAESFETFMCRFWLENEVWFASYECTPMLPEGASYVDQYRRAA